MNDLSTIVVYHTTIADSIYSRRKSNYLLHIILRLKENDRLFVLLSK